MKFQKHWQLAGWVMFAASGVFFTISAIKNGDWLGMGSAATWLIGVAFFLMGEREDAQ